MLAIKKDILLRHFDVILVYLFSSLPYWGFSVADSIKYLSNLNYP